MYHDIWKENIQKERKIRERWEVKYGRNFKSRQNRLNAPASGTSQKKAVYNTQSPIFQALDGSIANRPPAGAKQDFAKKLLANGLNLYRPADTYQWGDVGGNVQQTYTMTPIAQQPAYAQLMPYGDYSANSWSDGQKQDARREGPEERFDFQSRKWRKPPQKQEPRQNNSFRNAQYPDAQLMSYGDYSANSWSDGQKQEARREGQGERSDFQSREWRKPPQKQEPRQRSSFRNVRYPDPKQFNPDKWYHTNELYDGYERSWNASKQNSRGNAQRQPDGNQADLYNGGRWPQQKFQIRSQDKRRDFDGGQRRSDGRDQQWSQGQGARQGVADSRFNRGNGCKDKNTMTGNRREGNPPKNSGYNELDRARPEDSSNVAYYFICCHCGKQPYECQTVRAYCFPPPVYGVPATPPSY